MLQPEEIGDIDPNKKCCFNCKYFEERTCFCRLNPPTPMNTIIGGCQMTTSNFPRISIPNLDWCGKFEFREDQ